MVFKDKVVIITGASSGIGLACAREFASIGSIVVLAARNLDALNELAVELQSQDRRCLVVGTDVASEADCRHLIDETVKTFGRIDILINNAGISMRALLSDVALDVLRRLMDVNFWGTVYCTKFALPHLIATKGSVVGLSSIAGFLGLPGRTGYSASKFAVHGFLESVRIENLYNGLHVMIMAAGFTASNIRKAALTADGSPQGDSPRAEEKMMQPEQVARAIVRAIRKRKRNKILTIIGQLTVVLRSIIPDIVDREAFRRLASEPNSPFRKND